MLLAFGMVSRIEKDLQILSLPHFLITSKRREIDVAVRD
jgi:hypothetical protein